MSSEATAMTCGLAVVGLGVAKAAAAGHAPAAREVIGGAVFLILVTGLASVSPQLGTAVAVLALTSATLIAGPPVFAAITRTTTGK
jgi:hypothetical protein